MQYALEQYSSLWQLCSSHFCGPDITESAWWGSVTTVDFEGHIEELNWPYDYPSATTTEQLYFSIDLKDGFFTYSYCLASPYSVPVPGVSPHSLNPCPSCQGFSCCYLVGWYMILTDSKHVSKRAWTLLCSLLVCLGLHINISKMELCLMQQFSFYGPCFDTLDIYVSLLFDKLFEIKQLAHALLQRQAVTVCQAMSFLGKTIFVPMAVYNFAGCSLSFWVACWMLTNLLFLYFFLFPFLFQHSISFRGSPNCSRIRFLVMWLSLPMLCPILEHFIFRILGSYILLWHLVWFYTQSPYCLARVPDCCPHVV